MFKLQEKVSTHEDLFVERYDQLLSWAQRLTDYDLIRAQDLVHDCYIHWILARPELDLIRNLDGYFYRMLRNMHVAEIRRLTPRQTTSLSMIDYESLLVGLNQAASGNHARAEDELRAVCEYAINRKETSKAGSILILRFFHGYYPTEAARLAIISRVGVDNWLRIARSEARAYLDNPRAFQPLNQLKAVNENRPKAESRDFLDEIMQTVFRARKGRCPSFGQLRKIYESTTPTSLDCAFLGHLVSCQSCLERAGKILNLPSRSDGDPGAFLGRHPRPKLVSNNGKKSRSRFDRSLVRRLGIEDIFQHRPQELQIAVNGFIVGTQKINSAKTELSLKVNVLEQLGLLEILSEQGVRMLCAPLESPPEGDIEQSALVQLSDNRILNTTVSFRDAWPTIQISYHDPLFAHVSGSVAEIDQLKPVTDQQTKVSKAIHIKTLIQRLGQKLLSEGFWWRPATATIIISTLLLAAVLLVYRPYTKLSGSELLQNAVAAEANAGRTAGASHRVLNLEERASADRHLVSLRRIEIWQNHVSGVSARRSYDSGGRLVEGTWMREDGKQIFYHHGKVTQTASPPSRENLGLDADDMWQVDPSARSFSDLPGQWTENVEERDNTYILSYASTGEASISKGEFRILGATLVLRRQDLHALEMSIIAEQRGERKEYRFIETSYAALPVHDVDPVLFEPDSQLTGNESQLNEKSELRALPNPLLVPPVKPLSATDLSALEVDVLFQLNNVNALIGEEVNLSRTADGKLRIHGLLDTSQRKDEIVRAIRSLQNSRDVDLDILTVAEALQRQRDNGKNSGNAWDQVVINANKIPVDGDLRRYFKLRSRSSTSPAGQPSEAAIDEEILRFSSLVRDHSREALLHAFAAKKLIERFPIHELTRLKPEAREKWRAMIIEHARACEEHTRILRLRLGPVFWAGTTASEARLPIVQGFDQIQQLITELAQRVTVNDQVISQSFAVSPGDLKALLISTESFRQSLSRQERLAAALQDIH